MRNVESWTPTLDFLQQKLKVDGVSSKDPPEIPRLKRTTALATGMAFHVKSLDRPFAKGKSMKSTTTQDFPKDGAGRKS